MARRARLKACAGSARRRRPLENFGSFAHRNCLKLLEKGSKFSRLRRGLLAPMVRTGGRLRREPPAIGDGYHLLHATIAARRRRSRAAAAAPAPPAPAEHAAYPPLRHIRDTERPRTHATPHAHVPPSPPGPPKTPCARTAPAHLPARNSVSRLQRAARPEPPPAAHFLTAGLLGRSPSSADHQGPLRDGLVEGCGPLNRGGI